MLSIQMSKNYTSFNLFLYKYLYNSFDFACWSQALHIYSLALYRNSVPTAMLEHMKIYRDGKGKFAKWLRTATLY